MITNQQPTNILTVKDVAIYLKLAESTVYRLAQSGDLPAVKLGGNWRFSQTHLDHWFHAQSQQNMGNIKRG